MNRLPDPEPGYVGPEWTLDGVAHPPQGCDLSGLPRLSIVTPSLNQADYLEGTIRSILLQGYPDLEYIIIDGGSADGSQAIIRKYEPWLSYWTSEPDRGQSHAINKGFRRATGEVMAYFNSDDRYYPGALISGVSRLAESGADILLSSVDLVRVENGVSTFYKQESPREGTPIHLFPIFANGRRERIRFLQSGMFWLRRVWDLVGELDETYHYAMDRQWFTRALALHASVTTIDESLAAFSLHPGSKTQEETREFLIERSRMYRQFSRLPGFNRFPCLMESFRWRLRDAQLQSYARHAAYEAAYPLKAAAALGMGRALRRVRMVIDGLAGLK